MTVGMVRARQALSNLELPGRVSSLYSLPKAASLATISAYGTKQSTAELFPTAHPQDEARQVSSSYVVLLLLLPRPVLSSLSLSLSSAPFVLNQLSKASRADRAVPRG